MECLDIGNDYEKVYDSEGELIDTKKIHMAGTLNIFISKTFKPYVKEDEIWKHT